VSFARRTDPETSHEAASSVDGLLVKQAAVLRVLSRICPASDDELWNAYESARAQGEALPQQSSSGMRTRRKELVERGLVWDSGFRLLMASGRKAIAWDAKAQKSAQST
jgi:hypothetical protein